MVTSCTKDRALTKEVRIPSSDGLELEAWLAQPSGSLPAPALLLLHGFPSTAIDADHIGSDLAELADRVASEMGWVSLAIRFRGCGSSEGDFSLNGWVEDVHASLAYLRGVGRAERIWVCGMGTGGALGLIAAATEESIAGVATLGSPADFADWARQPDRLLSHAKEVGAISTPGFPADLPRWKSELKSARPTVAAGALFPRPLLVMHGAVDDIVPQLDGRAVADAHESADLRIVDGAGHQLRHDPRAVAVLLGWLERMRRS